MTRPFTYPRSLAPLLLAAMTCIFHAASAAADFPVLKQQIDSTSKPVGTGTCITTRTGAWLVDGGVVIEIQKPKGRCDFESLRLVVDGEAFLLAAVDSSFYVRRVSGAPIHTWYRGDSGKLFFATNKPLDS